MASTSGGRSVQASALAPAVVSALRGRAIARLRSLAWRMLGPPPTASTAPSPTDLTALNHWDRIAVLAEQHLATRRWDTRFHYTWAVLHAADVARNLGIPRIAALEFGRAGGNGLVALERAAEFAEAQLRIVVEVHGFDSGAGLPAPIDHRDAPYLMQKGQFPMDEAQLRARLRRTKLHLVSCARPSETLPILRAHRLGSSLSISTITLQLSTRSNCLTRRPNTSCPECCATSMTHSAIRGATATASASPFVSQTNGGSRGLSTGSRVCAGSCRRRNTAPAGSRRCLAHVLDHPRYADEEGTTLGTRLALEN